MQLGQNLMIWRDVFVMSSKNVVFMVVVNAENKKEYQYSAKYSIVEILNNVLDSVGK